MSTEKKWHTELLTSEHNEKMLKILASAPIEANGLVLTFDKQPDAFAIGEQKCDDVYWAGLFVEDELAGYGMLGHHEALIGGCPTTVSYYGNLYLDKKFRGFGLHKRIAEFLFGHSRRKEASYGYAIVMQGNQAAERHIGKGSILGPSIPHNRIAATLDARSVVVTTRKKIKSKLEIREARQEDIPAIVGLLQDEHRERFLGLVIDEDIFKRRIKKRLGFSLSDYLVAIEEGQIVGAAAAWDCVGFKQTRVLKYQRSMWPLRAGYALMGPFLKLPRLPRAGDPLRELYLTDVAVLNRDPQILEPLFAALYER
ncbi:hypothetical protein KAI87_13895, partial [Myxococcota bacterium]|nr:hypothetical protein [Myxococcota bacterium]